jgi:hypothetical protein
VTAALHDEQQTDFRQTKSAELAIAEQKKNMTARFPMEVHVSAELPNGREEWSSNGVTRLIPDSSTFTELFGQTLGEFCSTFANGLDPVNRQSSNFKLDTVETYIELTQVK